MAIDVKQYLYTKGVDAVLDADFDTAKDYAKVRPGRQAIFWKNGLRRYSIPVEEVQRVYRQLEPVIRRMCCGGKSYYIERLVMILKNGEELVIHIGDDVPKDAEALYEALKQLHPNLQYGKA